MIVRSMKDTLHTRHGIGIGMVANLQGTDSILEKFVDTWYDLQFLLVFLEDEKMGRQILICIIPALLFSSTTTTTTTTSRPRFTRHISGTPSFALGRPELGYLVLHSIAPYVHSLTGGLGGVVQRYSLEDISRFRYLPFT